MSTQRGSTRIPVYLATLSHPDLAALAGQVEGFSADGRLRIANWRHQFLSRGEVFIRGYFRAELPEAGALKSALRLSIDNVSQEVTYALMTLTSPAALTLDVVYAHQPDVVIRSYPNFELKGADITHAEVSGDFGPPPTNGPFMGITVNPSDNPGAFA